MTDASHQIYLVTEVETTETVTVQPRERDVTRDIGGIGKPQVTEQITIVRKRVPLDAAALKTQMYGLLQVMSGVFDQASQQTGLQLEEVELSVEINAEGQVSILGNGGKLADKGAIKLKFKRSLPSG